ncbi:5'-methylthioadenosine/S-adenosylhomocysteine nucleosidase [Barrientosiimonas marina]|uniref:5'-methylthioadenosine/S-adenosylhomocysteine nucleosidase n=1 Tax=Lentibacillus kimchii TaxID=1542911 RepID=A0ABW2V087_9BACI
MTIGIIGAMDEEVALLQSNMIDTETVTIANCLFMRGNLHHRDVVLLKSGIGKVNAAMATAILHEQFQPDQIINTGSAGGITDNMQVGDVIVSTQVVHHDVNATAFDYAYGQVPGMPAMFQADTDLVAQAGQAMKQLAIPFYEGVIASGDSFMSDQTRVDTVRRNFPSVLATEMEAAAIAQVCYQYDTPFVIIRALSDIAGRDSSISFDAFIETAARNAANLIMTIIKAP